MVRPGACDDLDDRGILALVNHDPGLVIGRSTNEVETLLLRKNTTALAVKIRPPNNSAGRDIVESIKRRDIDGMCFRFRTLCASGSELLMITGGPTRMERRREH